MSFPFYEVFLNILLETHVIIQYEEPTICLFFVDFLSTILPQGIFNKQACISYLVFNLENTQNLRVNKGLKGLGNVISLEELNRIGHLHLRGI